MIRLDARLSCAFDLLQGSGAVADIGADRGKLSAALLLYGGCKHVIAGDISSDCLDKTRQLIRQYGLQERAETRLGSGLSVLSPGECDAAAMLGMGGELMVELLQERPDVAENLKRLVLQPMSGIEELRRWLYENCYHVLTDRLVIAGRRWYQVICVQKGHQPDPWPDGFPRDHWLAGYGAFAERNELLGRYCEEQLQKRLIQLKQAAGTAGESRLAKEAEQLEMILKEIERWN